MSMHPEAWERHLNDPDDKVAFARANPHLAAPLARNRSAEFADGAARSHPDYYGVAGSLEGDDFEYEKQWSQRDS